MTIAEETQFAKEELEALIHEQGRAEMTCQFCDAVHVFEKDELEALAASL